jgi:hypothetical protein
MRRIHLIGVAVTAVVLAVAVAAAYAVPPSATTWSISAKVTPKKAGTKKKPKAEVVNLQMNSDTIPSGGSPATSTDIVIQLPKTLKWFGKNWPKSKQCDASAADAAKSNSVCPKGSRISLKTPSSTVNHVHATAQPDPTQPKIEEDLDLTAYVLKADPNHAPRPIKAGDLGLWLQSTPSAIVPISVMVGGTISKDRSKISVDIPQNVEEPVTGVPTGIEELFFTLDGKVKVKGKTYGAISSVGCKNKKWKTIITSIYRDGSKKSDFDTGKCSAKKKKK